MPFVSELSQSRPGGVSDPPKDVKREVAERISEHVSLNCSYWNVFCFCRRLFCCSFLVRVEMTGRSYPFLALKVTLQPVSLRRIDQMFKTLKRTVREQKNNLERGYVRNYSEEFALSQLILRG